MNNKLKKTTKILRKAILRLEKPTKTISRDSSLRDSNSRALILRDSLLKYEDSVRILVLFLNSNKSVLSKNEYYVYMSLLDCYNNKTETNYLKAFKRYIKALLKWTSFCSKNFEAIKNQEPNIIKEYEVYYLKYRAELVEKNKHLSLNIQYVKEKLKNNKELAKLISLKDDSILSKF